MRRKELEYPPPNPDLSKGRVVGWKFRESITFAHNRYSIRFQITFEDGTTENRECGGFKTKHEALEKKNELIVLLSNHQYVPYRITVRQFFDHWLYYYMIDERKIAYGTYLSYRNIIYNYLVPQIGDLNLIAADRGRLLAVLNSFQSESLLQMAYAVLSSSFQYAINTNLISINHAEAAIRTKRKLKLKEAANHFAANESPPEDRTSNRRYSLEAGEICRLLYLAKMQFPDFYLPLLLTCTTGCRISELIALRFCDVDYLKKQLSITGQIGRPVDSSDIPENSRVYCRIKTKTHAGIRTIPLSDFVLDEIAVTRERFLKQFGEHYDDSYQGYLCPSKSGGASNRSMYKKYFKILKEQMGMPKDFHWHDLRHAFATIMENNSVNLKELAEVMGHHSSDFTMNTYVEKKQPVFEGMRAYLDILERAAKGEETSRASTAGLRIVEYPGDPLKFTHLIEQARAPDRHRGPVVVKTEKDLATHGKMPYNYSN